MERIWDIETRVAENLAKAQEYLAKRHDTHRGRAAETYEPGDHVWLSTKGITMPWDKERKSTKLTARYYGPFEIKRQTSPVTFELKLPQASNIHPIMHVSLLKPYKSIKGHKAPPLPKENDKDEYEIESILAHRKTKGGKRKYLVKWKGYTFEESTWEPEENFKRQTIDQYNRQRKEEQEEESDSDDDQTHVVASMVDTEKLKTTTVERNASHDHGAERTQMEVDDTLHSQ